MQPGGFLHSGVVINELATHPSILMMGVFCHEQNGGARVRHQPGHQTVDDLVPFNFRQHPRKHLLRVHLLQLGESGIRVHFLRDPGHITGLKPFHEVVHHFGGAGLRQPR